jgi:hypothetical protein
METNITLDDENPRQLRPLNRIAKSETKPYPQIRTGIGGFAQGSQ